MLDETSLHNKINILQAEMLNFHKKISPIKSHNQIERNMLTYSEENKVLSPCIYAALGMLKVFVCITGPTVFPTIVYCIEGKSQLFWQVTAISCTVALLLAAMTASMLCIGMKKMQTCLEDTMHSLSALLANRRVFNYLREVLTSGFLQKNIYKVLYPSVILFASSLVCFSAYLNKIPLLLYGSLMLMSFVSGILSTIIYNLLQSPELLPLYSPHKIKVELTTPSPKAKKELVFSTSKRPNPSPASHFSTPSGSPLSDRNMEFIETETITAFIPNIPSSDYQETVGKTQYLQLPFNLDFFRRL